MNQQPTRPIALTVTPAISVRPRTQIEALPPYHPLTYSQKSIAVARSPMQVLPTRMPAFDPAVRHPVFFTDRLRKPPAGVGAGHYVSPVAMGYVSNDTSRRALTGDVKL
jgi:hypothetical protein